MYLEIGSQISQDSGFRYVLVGHEMLELKVPDDGRWSLIEILNSKKNVEDTCHQNFLYRGNSK